MPTINPDQVPTIAPGTLFSRLTSDSSLSIRWVEATDPVYFEVQNRPSADIALRQLILAKTLDTINLRLGHQALFPFLVQPQVTNGTLTDDVPLNWIWDMHPSMPMKWEMLRLAKIKRISGTNPTGTDATAYTGRLRLVFTANEVGATTEVSIFQVDYDIVSDLTYQIAPISIPTSTEESVPLPVGETSTVGGWVTFKTLDLTSSTVQDFLDLLAPPTGQTEGSDGTYPSPSVYQIEDSSGGGPTNPDDFDQIIISHGTGVLTLSAWNPIPALDSDINTWIDAFNYPFDVSATLQSASHPSIVVPTGLFREFNIVAPASDEPTGGSSVGYYPVYLSAIERLDDDADSLKFYFSTYALDTESITPVTFATLELSRSYDEGTLVPIIPYNHLWTTYATDDSFHQGFGKGFVVLSSMWGVTGGGIDTFFNLFESIIDVPPVASFSSTEGRVSSFGISRVPDNSPTDGQAAALLGTTFPTTMPSTTNKYIVQADQGKGTEVKWSSCTDLPVDKRVNPDIEDVAYKGSRAHHLVWLIVDSSKDNHNYNDDILPRLKILLGRSPIFGDEWYTGSRFLKYNGSSWVG